MKTTNKDTTDLSEYYYSKEKILDSIRYIVQKKHKETEIFVNDKSGNPVKYFKILAGGDTISNYLLQYQYDKYGNWVKKLETTLKKERFAFSGNDDPYSLVVREIKYSDK